MLDTGRAFDSIQGLRLKVTGVVQGVGFRPFVFCLAKELSIKGWVRNSAAGVDIAAEGAHWQLAQFYRRLTADRPPASRIDNVEILAATPAGYDDFEIRPSRTGDNYAGISQSS